MDRSDALGGKDTADRFTMISREIVKAPWFLEAHLQARCGPAALIARESRGAVAPGMTIAGPKKLGIATPGLED
jgi:hypothetical protein